MRSRSGITTVRPYAPAYSPWSLSVSADSSIAGASGNAVPPRSVFIGGWGEGWYDAGGAAGPPLHEKRREDAHGYLAVSRIAKERRHYDAETDRGMFARPKYLRAGPGRGNAHKPGRRPGVYGVTALPCDYGPPLSFRPAIVIPSVARNHTPLPCIPAARAHSRSPLRPSHVRPTDVIILDLVDPLEDGTAYLLYTDEFYRIAKWRRHYDAETHRGMFARPKYLRQGLAGETRINRDNAPLFMA